MALAPEGVLRGGCLFLGGCGTTPSISVTQYYRHRLPKEPSSPPEPPEPPSFTPEEIRLEATPQIRLINRPLSRYDPLGSQNLTNSANLGHFCISFLPLSITVIKASPLRGHKVKSIIPGEVDNAAAAANVCGHLPRLSWPECRLVSAGPVSRGCLGPRGALISQTNDSRAAALARSPHLSA